MKLSMETYVPCMKFGEKAGLELIKNAGFDAVDYSFYGDCHPSEVLNDGYREHALKVREYLDEIGLECNQAHDPFRMQYGDEFNMENIKFRELVHAIEAASIMGAEHIVVHSLAVPFGIDVMEYNEKYYKSLEPYCEKFGIKIAIENLFEADRKCGCFRGRIHTPQLLREMIERLASEWFTVCVDVGHCAITGIEPADMIRSLDKNILGALHIHDNDYKEDRHLFPYQGEFNWDEIMKALKDIDYQGDFTLEILSPLLKYSNEFIPDLVAFAAKTGRYLINKTHAFSI